MRSSESFTTLSEFLLQAGTEYFIIDVSRIRMRLDNQTFFDYENNKTAYATPRQGHAWLCVVFWNRQLHSEHYIWFLKLPVDEQGLLLQAARDQFLQLVIETLGQQMQGVDDKHAQLPDNPFIFTPSQQLLSDCNATIRYHLDLPERAGMHKALRYLKAPNVQPWSELSVQDMSDLATCIHQSGVQHAFVKHLSILPHPVCVCLFSTFEGIALPTEVAQHLLDYHRHCESSLAPMALRALASTNTPAIRDYVRQLVASEQMLDTETLIVIAGRHWRALSPEADASTDYLRGYFEKVAQVDRTYGLFRGTFADLVQLPELRVFILAMIRSDLENDALNKAIATLLQERQTT